MEDAAGQDDAQDTDAQDTDGQDTDAQDTDARNTDGQDTDAQDTDARNTDGQDDARKADGPNTDGPNTDGRDGHASGSDGAAAPAPEGDADAATTAAAGTAPGDTDVLDAVPGVAAPSTQDPSERRRSLREAEHVDPFGLASIAPAPSVPAPLPAASAAAPTVPAPAAPAIPQARRPEEDWYAGPLFTEGRSGLPRRTLLLWGVAVVAVLGVLYTGVAFFLTRSADDGTTIGGVDVSGLGRAEAVELLGARIDAATGGGVAVSAGDERSTLDPQQVGLETDPEALVDGVVGFTLNPLAVWHRVVGGEPRSVADEARLTAALHDIAASTDVPATNATVSFSGTEVEVTDGKTGRALDVPAALGVVAGGWLTGEALELPTTETEPEIGLSAAQRAADDIAEPALAGPLRLVVEDRHVDLDPGRFAPALSMVPGGSGSLQLAVDGKLLRAAALKRNPDLEVGAKDAGIIIKNGKPKITKAVAGRGMSEDDLAESARTALAGDRIAVVETSPLQPSLTTTDIKKLGITERVSTFATNLTDSADRTENLQIAARTVNNHLVLPGEEFSLNQVLGERTPEKGYNAAPAINAGRLVMDYGGGVSQMATTIFNNVFFSGLEDIYHKPHSFYISRYPEGREATVNWDTVDLTFKNDSPYGVLIQAWVDDQVHVSFWSTKVWDIESITGPRTNYRTPQTIYDDSAGCVAQGANSGFDVQVTRVFKKDGEEVKRETFNTTYIAEDQVICGPDPADEAKADPTTTTTSPPADEDDGTD